MKVKFSKEQEKEKQTKDSSSLAVSQQNLTQKSLEGSFEKQVLQKLLAYAENRRHRNTSGR